MAICFFEAGAKPHEQKDEVMSPNKSVLPLPTSYQEPTLSERITHSTRLDYSINILYNPIIPVFEE